MPEHVVHRVGDGPPPACFKIELAPSRGSDVIRACSTIVLGRDRPSLDPARLFHSMERRVQRALLNAECIREALNLGRNRVAMQGTPPVQNREDEKWQRSLQRV